MTITDDEWCLITNALKKLETSESPYIIRIVNTTAIVRIVCDDPIHVRDMFVQTFAFEKEHMSNPKFLSDGTIEFDYGRFRYRCDTILRAYRSI